MARGLSGSGGTTLAAAKGRVTVELHVIAEQDVAARAHWGRRRSDRAPGS